MRRRYKIDSASDYKTKKDERYNLFKKSLKI